MADNTLDFRSRTLEYIDAVSRHETFSEASEALHISQPAISQAIATLEEQLGVELFEPHGRRRVLTEAGKQVAEFAAEVLGRTAELRQWLDTYSHGQAGTLTLGMIDAAMLYLLPRGIEQFRADFPEVDLKIFIGDSNSQLRRLRDFEIDLALIVEPVPDDLSGTEIAREELYLYGPPEWSEKLPPEETSWALPPASSRTRTLIEDSLSKLKITPNVTLESNNPIVLRQLVALGFGCSVLPQAIAAELPSDMQHRLVCPRSIYAVSRPSAPEDARVEAFIFRTQQPQ